MKQARASARRIHGRHRLPALGLVLGALGRSAVAAAEVADDGAFDHFMQASRPVCVEQPAEVCVGLAWRFADADGDQALSLDELLAVRRELGDWALRHRDELTGPERSSLTLGLLLVDSIGLERLLGLYDADADGLVSRSELLADVTLDQRPLGETLLDPAAVDRAAIARRLGVPPALLDRIEPPSATGGPQ